MPSEWAGDPRGPSDSSSLRLEHWAQGALNPTAMNPPAEGPTTSSSPWGFFKLISFGQVNRVFCYHDNKHVLSKAHYQIGMETMFHRGQKKMTA